MLFITWCCNLKSQNLWVLGSTSELVILTILAKKKSLSIEFPEAKSQREKMYLMGALDSA
jgi:hypothetical protein